MAVKPYTVKETINDKEYIAQFSGLSVALRAVDESYIEGTNNTSMEKLAEYLFKYVIVEPKGLTVDDFEDMDEFNNVVAFANKVMKGEFRDHADAGAAKATSKK